jgi:hypothetical protein
MEGSGLALTLLPNFVVQRTVRKSRAAAELCSLLRHEVASCTTEHGKDTVSAIR